MAAVATTAYKVYELAPNASLKEIYVQSYNTADATNTLVVDLRDYGFNKTGIWFVEAWVHTADGSIITTEADTTTVAATGIITVTIAAGTNDDTRVVRIVGQSLPNVY